MVGKSYLRLEMSGSLLRRNKESEQGKYERLIKRDSRKIKTRKELQRLQRRLKRGG